MQKKSKVKNGGWTITEWRDQLGSFGVIIPYHRVRNWLIQKYIAGELRQHDGFPVWFISTPPLKENVPDVRRGRKKPSGKIVNV